MKIDIYIYYFARVKAVKYIYKYIYKGHDKVDVYITQDDRTISLTKYSNFKMDISSRGYMENFSV